jgi:hypothetical protein
VSGERFILLRGILFLQVRIIFFHKNLDHRHFLKETPVVLPTVLHFCIMPVKHGLYEKTALDIPEGGL